MLSLLLWLVIEVTEALEELKKLLQTIKNSKYASCNSYIIIVILLTCYFHTMQIRQEQAGGGRVDVEEGVEKRMWKVDIETIIFLNSMYIVHFLFNRLFVYHLFIHSCLKVGTLIL